MQATAVVFDRQAQGIVLQLQADCDATGGGVTGAGDGAESLRPY